MSEAGIKIINISEFSKALESLSADLRTKGLTKALDAGGYVLEGAIKVEVENQHLVDTGALKSSIKKRPAKVYGDSGEVEVGTNIVYAAIHEFGGIIKPRTKKALTFKTKDGRWHTVQRVVMPARPYMRPAVQKSAAKIEAALKAALGAHLERYGKH